MLFVTFTLFFQKLTVRSVFLLKGCVENQRKTKELGKQRTLQLSSASLLRVRESGQEGFNCLYCGYEFWERKRNRTPSASPAFRHASITLTANFRYVDQ